jgi:hypothetical protein
MLTELLFSAVMGWCGTRYPGWWRRKIPPPPPPDWFMNYFKSDPMPGIIFGIIGGIAGGLLMRSVAVVDQLSAIGLAGFAGGRILSDLAGAFRSGMK